MPEFLRKLPYAGLALMLPTAAYGTDMILNESYAAAAIAETERPKNNSIHLTQQFDPALRFQAIGVDLTVQHIQPERGIFAALQFKLDGGGTGYAGIQETPEGGQKLVMAFWDSEDSGEDTQPAGVGCKRFGHEGKGSHCLVETSLTHGNTYNVSVLKTATDGATDTWSGRVTDLTTGEVTPIGSINTIEMGDIRPKTHMFVEDFDHPQVACSIRPLVVVEQANLIGFSGGAQYRPVEASFSDNHCDAADVVIAGPHTYQLRRGAGA